MTSPSYVQFNNKLLCILILHSNQYSLDVPAQNYSLLINTSYMENR